jgi:divalent metal cation (Fe/Co/Zn/Cd) transporter
MIHSREREDSGTFPTRVWGDCTKQLERRGCSSRVGHFRLYLSFMAIAAVPHSALVLRGKRLSYVSLSYNLLEALVSLWAGLLSNSVALLSFGIDSLIEVSSSGAALWRLQVERDPAKRERVERMTHRIIGWCFLALAAYVGVDSALSLWHRERPDRSVIGILILTASVVVMPLLARAKRRVAVEIGSRSLTSDAKQTSLCAYLSAIALLGVGLNAVAGWWWADPVAALCMIPIIVGEGLEGVKARDRCDCC